MELIRDLLLLCMSPHYWMQLNPYSDAWDDRLVRLMRNNSFTDIGRHTAMIGDQLVWISNHPYASFSPYGTDCGKTDIRPSRLTLLRAHRKLRNDMIYAASGDGGDALRRKAFAASPWYEWIRRHK